MLLQVLQVHRGQETRRRCDWRRGPQRERDARRERISRPLSGEPLTRHRRCTMSTVRPKAEKWRYSASGVSAMQERRRTRERGREGERG